MSNIQYHFDYCYFINDQIIFVGWALDYPDNALIEYAVQDEKGQHLPLTVIRQARVDVAKSIYGHPVDHAVGFQLTFEYTKQKKYQLIFQTEKEQVHIALTKRLLSLLKLKYWKYDLMVRRKSLPQRLNLKKRKQLYEQWLEETTPNKEQQFQQSQTRFAFEPKFSIVIPLYETNLNLLKQLLASIQRQTYSNFEICFADGSRTNVLERVIDTYRISDDRLKYYFIGENLGISKNTNFALNMATGDFIVLCDHDDILTPNALFELVKAINEHPDADCLYSDEDKLSYKGDQYSDANFKPDFNLDLLLSQNYINHLFCVRKSLVDQYGGFQEKYDGAQDYDFILRMCTYARKVVHIPYVLYHWRKIKNSTAENPESKIYAFENGKKVLMDYYKKFYPDLPVERIEYGCAYGIYQPIFKIKEEPLVSIIIPNKDGKEDLDQCIRSIQKKSTYRHFEFIIVENNSTTQEIFEYYEQIQKEYDNVHVVYYTQKGFNYSKLNRFGVEHAHGEYYLFMNNDIELIDQDSLTTMVGYGMRDDVGIVGCLLKYPDGTIQHAGVVIGIMGVAAHIFGTLNMNETYFNRALITQDYSAVTAAVMLVRKDVYEKTIGFDPTFAVAFNDIDFCLQVRDLGYKVVYTPYATFTHYESKTRGYEDTPEKLQRFKKECLHFREKWRKYFVNGDPYYSPNATLKNQFYEIRDIQTEPIGREFITDDELETRYNNESERLANIQ